jgi:hypothetical protein
VAIRKPVDVLAALLLEQDNHANRARRHMD